MGHLRATVIVPMYNAEAHVLDQLDALAAQSVSADVYEVVWVDNGSSDGTFELVANATPSRTNMTVIRADAVPTSYFARNAGAAIAKGPLLLFCDADDVVDTKWVETMVAALETTDLAGGSLEFTRLNPRSRATPASSSLEVRHGFLPAAPTCNLGVRREVFEAVGGFRADRLSGEDLALCWRAQLRGFSMEFVPAAIVYSRFRSNARARFARQFRFGWRHRSWATEFVEAGAEDLRPPVVFRLVARHAAGMVVSPPRRAEASSFAWHLGVLYSFVRAPVVRPRRTLTR